MNNDNREDWWKAWCDTVPEKIRKDIIERENKIKYLLEYMEDDIKFLDKYKIGKNKKPNKTDIKIPDFDEDDNVAEFVFNVLLRAGNFCSYTYKIYNNIIKSVVHTVIKHGDSEKERYARSIFKNDL
jgi:hypothetical protein